MTEQTTPIEVSEGRRRPRFNMKRPIDATFAGQQATVTNISAEGLGLAHATPVKINSAGTIRIESEENTANAAFRGRVCWSRLSRTANAEGKYLYNSGLRIEDASDAAAGLLGRLIRAFGERDCNSLQLKQKTAEEKAASRASLPAMLHAAKPSGPKINPDQVLLVREARTILENHPESAQEWYNRAKYSLAKRNMLDESRPSPYRRDVIVIWEYLGGRIELDTITAVLDACRESAGSQPSPAER